MPGSGRHNHMRPRSITPRDYRSVRSLRKVGRRRFNGNPSEVGGFSRFWLGGFLRANWAVYGADVAEAAFLSAGHASCGFIGHQLANEGSEILDELVGQRSPWESRSVRRVDDLAAEGELLRLTSIRQIQRSRIYGCCPPSDIEIAGRFFVGGEASVEIVPSAA